MKRKILIIDDDVTLCSQLTEYLELSGLKVESAHDGKSGLEKVESFYPDVILLDIILPDYQGYEIGKEIKAKNWGTPILYFTGTETSTESMCRTYDYGAVDFITKPAPPVAIELRIKTWLDHSILSPKENKKIYKIGESILILTNNQLKHRDTEIELSEREALILRCLLENPDKLIYTDTIMKVLWNHGSEENRNSLRVYISDLRNSLKPLDSIFQIKSKYSKGYILEIA